MHDFFLVTTERPVDPCNPSPCGPNSECRVRNRDYICSCRPNYFGNPPDCRPECVVNSDCDDEEACVRQKCVDPCPGICGVDALCEVKNHNPICFCPTHLTGDPFVRCIPFRDRKYFLNIYICFKSLTLLFKQNNSSLRFIIIML